MGVVVLQIGPVAAWEAGHIFRKYRESGGPRKRFIPDFLIVAHAQMQAERLATVDRPRGQATY